MSEQRVDLVDAARRLALAAGTTLADPHTMAEATSQLLQIVRVLSQSSAPSVPSPSFEEAAYAPGYHSHQYNPALPALDLSFASGVGRASVVLGSLYEGPPGRAHGGVLALLFDSALTSLVQHEGRLAVTGTLNLRYVRPTPLHRELQIEVHIDEQLQRKVLASGYVVCDGERTVEASGVFVDLNRS
jgi:acyl-coenzyme A thioesterase PaaI-like protein